MSHRRWHIGLTGLAVLLLAAPAMASGKTNRLANADSPYLREHADNPVDWYPWGKEAFARAKAEGKPILLSVGYSTCHWCHVMRRESFEDKGIAKLLKRDFIAIKVDRERRPGVDAMYMLATEILTGRGGWPNTVFLTPDLKPFWAATYLPKDAFANVLTAIATHWKQTPGLIKGDAERISGAIKKIMTRQVAARKVTPKALTTAAHKLASEVDDFFGGLGTAPKFPRESELLFLLHQAARDKDAVSLKAVTLTLDGMLAGGIYDRVGGGFHRYAVDPAWRIPHFEKMGYNQALISLALLRSYVLTGEKRYAAGARRTLDWVLEDLTAPGGGFYSAYDADSDGHEGTYYTWTFDELKVILADDLQFAKTVLGISANGNFEGRNILHLTDPKTTLAKSLGLPAAEFEARLQGVMQKLRKVRRSRHKPHRDEKILAAWTGLLIVALAEAGEVLGEDRYIKAALKAADFVWRGMDGAKGALKHDWYDGKLGLPANQKDYAYMALAMIKLYDVTADPAWLERAQTFSKTMVEKFSAGKTGDFYLTAAVDGFVRVKERSDAEIPQGNAIALQTFAKLARRSRNPVYRTRAEAVLAALSGIAMEHPQGSASALVGADMLQRGEIGHRQFLGKGVVRAEARHTPDAGMLTVSLTLADGWHVNAHKPLEEFFIPTTLSLETEGGAVVVSYPEAQVKKLGFHAKKVAIYEGRVELAAKLPASLLGKRLSLRAKLKLQACSDKICLEPEETVLLVRAPPAKPPEVPGAKVQ